MSRYNPAAAAKAAMIFANLGLSPSTRQHMQGPGRKTMYYYHHPNAHNAGSHPVPGGGLRERHRRMVRSMLAEWQF
jgi:hypothetical protein